jgi:hypothetical protein
MTTVGKFATLGESRMSKQIATNDDDAANEEEVEEQIEEENVEKAAGEYGTGIPIPFMSNSRIETADDAEASSEEVEEQVERKHVEKKALGNRISAASAQKRTRNGPIRG